MLKQLKSYDNINILIFIYNIYGYVSYVRYNVILINLNYKLKRYLCIIMTMKRN